MRNDTDNTSRLDYLDFMLNCSAGASVNAQKSYGYNGLFSQEIKNLKSILDALLNNPYQKIVIADKDGNIIFINDAYCNFAGFDRKEVVGKHALHVLGKETRLHIIGKTLKHEPCDLFHTANRDAVARRFPLISGGRFFGVLGTDLFDNLDDLFLMAQKAEGRHKITPGFTPNRMKVELKNRARYGLSDIISKDPKIIEIKDIIKTAALTTSTILLHGETGVGKELFAHAIHKESKRRNGPFVRVNCAAIPETLLESELFGYDEGAFTGARKGGKPGKFELANGGTIFLDEIGEIPLCSQVKILRVLQEKEIERVGGTESIALDVRVVAATNRGLWEMAEKGLFRKDLLYRINVVSLRIPPLRERPGDIPLLTNHIIDKYNKAFDLDIKGIAPCIMRQFERYDWPGNVRELETVIESAMNKVKKTTKILSNIVRLEKSENRPVDRVSLREFLEREEKGYILSVLKAVGWNMEETAAALSISPASLYRKIAKYNIR